MSVITWYGHSAFKICCKDVTVVIDPFFAHDVEYIMSDLGNVDLVLVTHDHGDHVGEAVAICRKTGAMLGAIVGTAGKLAANGVPEKQLLNGIGFSIGGTLVYKQVSITMTQAFHSSDSGAPVGYILQMPDGLILYHAGDTCVFQDMALWGQLYKIDVALLPVGGVFTMDGEQAALACSLLQCRSVIPMHWGTFPALAQDTNAFCQALARRAPQCQCLNLSPGQSLQLAPEGKVC